MRVQFVVSETSMQLNPLSTPPTDPGQVVIVVMRRAGRVLAMTFKYKKGKWCGCQSGDKYTTEELVGAQFAHGETGWMPSPLQPIYEKG